MRKIFQICVVAVVVTQFGTAQADCALTRAGEDNPISESIVAVVRAKSLAEWEAPNWETIEFGLGRDQALLEVQHTFLGTQQDWFVVSNPFEGYEFGVTEPHFDTVIFKETDGTLWISDCVNTWADRWGYFEGYPESRSAYTKPEKLTPQAPSEID